MLPPHRCNIPSDWLSGQSPIQRVLHFQLDNGHPAETVETPDTPPLFGVSPSPTQEASLIGAVPVSGQQKS